MTGHEVFGRGLLMVTSGYPPAQSAGLERGCQRLAQAIARRGIRVSVLTSAVPGLAADVEECGVRILRVLAPRGPSFLWGWSYRRQVGAWLERLLPAWDVAMCHQLYLHSPVANAVAHAHGRRACHLLVAAQEYSDVKRLADLRGGARLLRQAVDDADALFVLSGVSRAELLAIGAPSSRVHDYRYFVDAERFSPRPGTPDQEFLCLGRWHPQKNVPLLIDAFERVAETHPEARLRIVGAGPEEAIVRARVGASSARQRIRVEGWAADPVEAYRQAWALVMSSDAEGLSNVLIEAMACGVPVVTTDVSGAREVLDLSANSDALASGDMREGTGGFMVRRGDSEALARAMRRVLSSPEVRADLAAAARARIVDAFTEGTSVALVERGLTR